MSSKCAETDEEIDAELGLSEDHFSRPDGLFGFSTLEELEMAIENCKDLILDTPEKSEKRKKLVRKLVQLRLKLQDLKEGTSESPPEEEIVLGHHFCKGQNLEQTRDYCEKCCGLIIAVLHAWYRCQDCGFRCHSKCLNMITRKCANIKVTENPSYLLDICPESSTGLASQKYRCAECHTRILFKVGFAAPRRCDYNGLYYCSYCHWDNEIVIPARVIHNWDFKPQKVCRTSLQFLRLMIHKPILNVEVLNQSLLSFVQDLALVKKLREEILVMKQYFLACHAALEGKLLLELKQHQHFVEEANHYSLQDLIDLEGGNLLEFLEQVHKTFQGHIVNDCESCRGKGFICEICQNSEVLFPFQDLTVTCSQCSTVFHRECYQAKATCPRCERRARANS